MSRGFLARCHHDVCSDIFDRPLPNIKLDRNLVLTGSFFAVHFADDVRDVYEKKLPTKSQRKAIVDDFPTGRQYERLEGQEGRRFSATKMNFKKLPAGGGARG